MVSLNLHGLLEEWSRSCVSNLAQKTQLRIDQGLSTKPNAPNLIDEKVGNGLELIDTGVSVQDVSIKTIDKCHPLKPKTFLMGKDTSFKQNDSLKNGRKSLQIIHLTVSL